MDSDTALRFHLTASQYEESPAIVIAADEGETEEEAGDAEHDQRGADKEDEEEGEAEAE